MKKTREVSFPPLGRPLTPYEVRARKLLVAGPVELIHNPTFENGDQVDEILAPMPAADYKPRKVKPPAGLDDPYLLDLYNGDALLTRDQEAHQFRKMNFLKFDFNRRLCELRPTRPLVGVLNALEAIQNHFLQVQAHLVRANLRLVVSVVKRARDKGKYLDRDFFEMVSDGNESLMRAVMKFDYARGNKFSTYATWAIVKNLPRGVSGDNVPEAAGSGGEFGATFDDPLEQIAESRSDELQDLTREERVKRAVLELLDSLKDDRERRIIIGRYGLCNEPEHTLEELGRELGITKERVRQIETRAQDKLRRAHPELEAVLT